MSKTFTFIAFLLSWVFVQSTSALTPPAKNNNKKPNIIIIMADDLGYADVGFNGCKDIPTPNIDRIANNGVKFTNGYTSYSVCGPRPPGLMTGRYQQRFGFERHPQYKPQDPNMGLPQTESTLAETLSQVHYTSGIIGKWHLGADISNHPLNRGFTEFFGHLGGGHNYMPEMLTIKDSYAISTEKESYQTWILRNHTPVQTKEYLTDEFSNEAVRFVERNQKAPFFLFLSYNAPHTPMQATEKYLNRFPNIKNKKRKTYAAMVSAVDDGVGHVLNTLEALGLEENTLIFFLSDNGGPEPKNASNNGYLREGKGSIYEGGYRVPFAMQWKGNVKPGVYHHPISSLDIFATIADLSNAPLKKDKPLDGVNIVPYLKGKKKGAPHENIFLRKFDQNVHAVRKNDYKLIVKFDSETKELYNLKEDGSEKHNLANKYPEKVKELNALRLSWESELIDPLFLGLIHTEAWQKKIKKNQNKKKKNQKK